MPIFLAAILCGMLVDHERMTGGEPAGAAAIHPSAHDETELSDLWMRKRGADWSGFLGPTADSKSIETGIISPWPEGGPRLVWQHRVGAGYGIGSVCRGRYYHFDRWDASDGSQGLARVTCRNAETGEELWKFQYPTDYLDRVGYDNGPRSSPVIDGNRLYVFGAEGLLHCLRASDGAVIWKVDTTAKFGVVQNFFGVGSTPVVEGDLLICVIGGSPLGSPGLYESSGKVDGNGTGIVAFNKFTGEVKYAITNELAGYASPKLTTIDNRRWCFVLARGGLVGFDPSSGREDFHFPWRATLLESVNASTPVVVDSEVFITEAYQIGSALLAVKPGSVRVVWQDRRRQREMAMKAHWNTPIHLAGYLYGCSGRNTPDADLRCVEWKTGKVSWVYRGNLPERSSLLYLDGHFICLGEFGTLRLIRANPAKCEVVSQVILRGAGTARDPYDMGPSRLLKYPCWAAPIVAHGLAYVRGADRVVCLEVIPGDDRALSPR